MDLLLDPALGGVSLLLSAALLLALGFEFVNGFHDTANAVATVIYTNTLRPTAAVVWAGAWNFLGVLFSSGVVAFGIVALLPIDLIVNLDTRIGAAMVFALLLAAIIWNLGTWYIGLPASSSHALIGSIVGVGLMNTYLAPQTAFGEGINWSKVADIGLSLLVSPLAGFGCAFALMWVARRWLLDSAPALFREPQPGRVPPLWIRTLLVLTCTGVSFAHGSNDGQKGMGLIMLVLIGLVPGLYALNLQAAPETLAAVRGQAAQAAALVEARPDTRLAPNAEAPTETLKRFVRSGALESGTLGAFAFENRRIAARLEGVAALATVPGAERNALRAELYLAAEAAGRLAKEAPGFDEAARTALRGYRTQLKQVTEFIPTWVKIASALALGLGTMIGWKRIVVTIGEKIGKSHLSYGQGASAELVAASTIGVADTLGLPVSTTHVLSSGVAGTMVANKSGVHGRMIRNLLLAWVLTLPMCVFLGAMLFAGALHLVFSGLGLR